MPPIDKLMQTRGRPYLQIATELAPVFAERAAAIDRENRFPFENFADLRERGYLAMSVPSEYGGGGVTSLEMARAQEQLARGDGSTALAATMHLGLVGRLADTRIWPEETFAGVCRDIVEHGALLNSAHSEPDLGSPSRGGLPSTTAVRTGDGWLINGRKSWTSLAPALTYAIVLAAASGDGRDPRRENFLVRMDTPGITVLETWDNQGMRGTASHDVRFENVLVPPDALVPGDGAATSCPGDGRDWGAFAGSAVFLGLAGAARDEAVRYAQTRIPNGMAGPIATLQTIQHRVAEMELLLLQARALFYDVAERWQANPAGREAMAWQLAAVKHTVSNHAIRIGELAIRIMGSAAFQRARPIERIGRDIRVSIGQPPIDDMALTTIGKAALGH